ncbi:TPA: phage tail protein [Bacillus cereus]|uniref:phage tail protein n=1 Tax=Bacillus TaxID=1386 RepID=UPI002AB39906|nr:phage tail protein [Bacillus thuringiensis]MDY8162686.1 phage tail protein [Bacillus thuringiensis]HDR6247388.1 phage tail protein [Bacillus cereus]HDR7762220.1 phage tail protein [Bacillus cereus]
MVKVIEEFDSVSIANASIQFKKKGTQEPGTKFGCVGSIEGEPENKEMKKTCGGVTLKKKSKTTELKVTVSAHIPVKVARDYFGFNTTGLKPGVWAFGSDSKGYDFVFTADVVDEYQDVVKLIAFPNCSNSTGFKFAIASGEEELAMMELEFTALPDDLKNFYYEAFVDELADATVAQKWHTQFNSALVKGTTSA